MVRKSVVTAAALLALLPLGASARGVSDDFGPSLSFTALVSSPSSRSTESLSFAISPFLFSDGSGGSASVKIAVTLPAGIHWAGTAPGAREGCTRTAQEAACSATVPPVSGTNVAQVYGVWQVVAERQGNYRFDVALLENSRPDPNASNDTASLAVNVRTVRSGVTLRPRLPRAGQVLVASHRVLVLDNEGRTFPILKGTVACSARIGSVKVKAVGALSDGRATCKLKTLPGAKGKVVSGTILTTSAGLVLTKQFRATLG